ncbi:MAG: hypothetical protein EON93_10195 [Burkholderiales bacterium]|nr:MAG: hypothetical protein EON93_10195 [Burkholderiales bacterium]
MRRPFSRLAFLGFSAVLLLTGAGAGAQTRVSPSEYVSCPRARLAIYFASGETTATPEALALIGRIGETAANCQPDGIDLVAQVNSRVDGDRAMALALARLSEVAEDLVEQGISVDRIRVAAQASGGAGSPINQIDVVFRKTSAEVADEVVAPPKSPTAPSGAI